MLYIIAMLLCVVGLGLLDARLKWPKPTEKVSRYVSVAERSKTLRR